MTIQINYVRSNLSIKNQCDLNPTEKTLFLKMNMSSKPDLQWKRMAVRVSHIFSGTKLTRWKSRKLGQSDFVKCSCLRSGSSFVLFFQIRHLYFFVIWSKTSLFTKLRKTKFNVLEASWQICKSENWIVKI